MRPTGNFYKADPASNNFMNKFQAGSNADILQPQIDGASSVEDIYGTSTAAASKPQINFTRGESSANSLSGSIR
jgi:hypothetical protein